MLGLEPVIFNISSKNALKNLNNEEKKPLYDWEKMQGYIMGTLNSAERIKLKLLSPLGVASKLTEKYLKIVADNLSVLKEDIKTIEAIQSSLDIFVSDMKKEFEVQQQRIDNILQQLQDRANKFFDEFLVVSNLSKMLNKHIVAEKFMNTVIRDVNHQIDNHISNVIDWIIDKKYRQWKAITDYVYKRAKNASSEEKLVGSLKNEFNFNRKVF